MKKNILNRRRKKIYFPTILILLFFLIIVIYILLFYDQKIFKQFNSIIENYSDKYQYSLSVVNINGLNNINEDEILNLIKPYKDSSIFLIPIKKIAKKISQNNWVKSINIQSNYKDTIEINIDESKPIGIYTTGIQNILFSDDLKILENIANNEKRFSALIKFEGKNSIHESIKLIDSFPDDFQQYVDKAFLINQRRWDLELKNSILLKLPENNIKEALENYKKIYINFSNEELIEIESIDLRMKQKIILKYKEIIK
ncbi:MAG: Cell division protein FtsQ [Alphaproteobacteria bacterium MarineAlpha5_Bin3]|nr:MAG: Cell division protein FtsQ [Alphaproteobacteria bacterium MarineAlpha5_Bin3]